MADGEWRYVGEPGEPEFLGGWRNITVENLRQWHKEGLSLPPGVGFIEGFIDPEDSE